MSDSKSLFLVSGGSGGIGSAVCEQLAASGYRPVVAYHRNVDGARAVAARCNGGILQLDLESEESIRAAVDSLEAAPLPLAGVVLAGSPPPVLAPFGKIAREDLQQQLQVHVLGPQQLLAQLVRRCFRKQMQGTVVGVLSKAMGEDGQNAASGMGAYVIGKYGMAGVLAMLASDYPWLNVRTVRPGYTETDMLKVFDERYLELQRAQHEFQTPDQVAAEIVREAIAA